MPKYKCPHCGFINEPLKVCDCSNKEVLERLGIHEKPLNVSILGEGISEGVGTNFR